MNDNWIAKDIHGREIPKSLPGFSGVSSRPEREKIRKRNKHWSILWLGLLGSTSLVLILGMQSKETSNKTMRPVSFSKRTSRPISPLKDNQVEQSPSFQRTQSRLRIVEEPETVVDQGQADQGTLDHLREDRRALEALLSRVHDETERDHINATIAELKQAESELRTGMAGTFGS